VDVSVYIIQIPAASKYQLLGGEAASAAAGRSQRGKAVAAQARAACGLLAVALSA